MIEHDPDFYDAFEDDSDIDDFGDDDVYDTFDTEDLGEAYEFDTFDRIIDESEICSRDPELGINPNMSVENWGMVFALADELADEKMSKYDLNAKTDMENFEMAIQLNPVPNSRAISRNDEDFSELTFDDLGIEEMYRRDFEHILGRKA
jgi:hypothetical protein